jgi:hypothetical protein
MGKTQLQDRFTSGDCSGTLNDFDIQALLASAPDTSFIDDATFDTCAHAWFCSPFTLLMLMLVPCPEPVLANDGKFLYTRVFVLVPHSLAVRDSFLAGFFSRNLTCLCVPVAAAALWGQISSRDHR